MEQFLKEIVISISVDLGSTIVPDNAFRGNIFNNAENVCQEPLEAMAIFIFQPLYSLYICFIPCTLHR